MNCPKCGKRTKVLGTRRRKQFNESITRRRVCPNCGYRYTTYEVNSDVIDNGEVAKDMLRCMYEFVTNTLMSERNE